MSRCRRAAGLILLAAAVGLSLLGQHYFLRRRDYLWDGLAFFLIAAACFLLAWRLARPHVQQSEPHRASMLGAWLRARSVPLGLLGLGLSLSLMATLLVAGRALDEPTYDAVFLWLAGCSLAFLAALWPSLVDRAWRWPSLAALRARVCGTGRSAWLEVASMLLLTLLALLLRVTALDHIPFTLGGDEAWHGLLARQVLHGQLRNPFAMGYMSMPTAFYWPLSWTLWLAGDGMAGARLAAALAGTVSVPVFYIFVRRLWGWWTALLSATFLAAYHYHIHYSRLSANNIWDPLFVILALWAVDVGLESGDLPRRTRAFVLGGLAAGLSVYFYTGVRLLPLLIGAYVAFAWWRERREQGRGAARLDTALLVLAFMVAAAPMLSYALAHPGEWNARLNQVGIFQSGWLAREPGLTGKTTAYILAEQFLRAAGAFHVFADRTVWYGADRPLLGFLPGVLALLGLVWAVAHWRQRRHFLLLLWFWTVIITGGTLTESPPSSQRLVIAIPAVALLVTVGLQQTVRLARRFLGIREHLWGDLAVILLMVMVVVGSVCFYFVEFTPTRRYGSANGETATMMGHYLSELEGVSRAYLFGAPRLYWSFGTMAFLAPGVYGEDVADPLSGPPNLAGGAVCLFLPERSPDLEWVEQAYPGGKTRRFYDYAGHLRFITYRLP